MTETRRIALNIVATYGRTFFSIACGLFAGRWTLMALGEVDYGLYGVVGGLVGFIGFINGLMASAIGRFYAYSVGQASLSGGEGVEICRKWFNTAVMVHSTIPLLLVAVGYPIGAWAVENWLTIPPDRVHACIWVLRCVCLSCFVGMINVPFSAMYTAKQYIAELTIYSVVQTACNVVFLYYMVSHPGVWLTKYAIWACALSISPQLLICLRATKIFPECKFNSRYLWDIARFRELFVFAAYRFGGAMCVVVSQQGMNLLVNKIIGPAKNAAMSVGGSVAGYSQSLAGATSSAFYPVITNAAGAGNLEKMRRMSFVSCKLAASMVLIFVLPLLLEVREVMRLWLENPPDGTTVICSCLLIIAVLENATCGHYMAIFSVGRIRDYQINLSIGGLSALLFAWVGLRWGYGISAVGLALILSKLICCVVRLYFGKKECGLSIIRWVTKVFIPLCVCSIVSLIPGAFVVLSLHDSFLRVCLTTLVIELAFLPLMYFGVFGVVEREFVTARMNKIFNTFRRSR